MLGLLSPQWHAVHRLIEAWYSPAHTRYKSHLHIRVGSTGGEHTSPEAFSWASEAVHTETQSRAFLAVELGLLSVNASWQHLTTLFLAQ